MKCVILNWNSISDISLALDENGEPILFDIPEDAEKYAKESFAWNYEVVGVGD